MVKYNSINRANKSNVVKELNKTITIEEKIDGANASFLKTPEGQLGIFSRNNQLDPIKNTLSGFYPYIQNHLKNKMEKLNPQYIYFGEWLVPHKIQYKEYKIFYLFDVFDIANQVYLPYDIVQFEAEKLELKLVPLLYQGVFLGNESLIEFVGKSTLTTEPDKGEGIVVKFIHDGDRKSFKIVSEEFSERKVKLQRVNMVDTPEGQFVLECVNRNRVEKIIMKLKDENLLNGELIFENMKNLIKQITPLVYNDVIKEESDDIHEDWDIGKYVSKTVPIVLKEILNEYYL